uniref:Uncharacterized protein n=1 Tax=Bionectria ochroleuca TaxID=29856 RepID=A0A0B7JZR0_BIOOC
MQMDFQGLNRFRCRLFPFHRICYPSNKKPNELVMEVLNPAIALEYPLCFMGVTPSFARAAKQALMSRLFDV